jgi:hypothetical protein
MQEKEILYVGEIKPLGGLERQHSDNTSSNLMFHHQQHHTHDFT